MVHMESVRAAPDLSGLFDLHGTLLRVPAGSTLAAQGQSATSVYRVVQGCIRSCIYSEDGQRNVLQFHQAGAFMGLTGAPDWAMSQEAVVDTTVLSVSQDVLQAALRRSQALNDELRDILGRQIRAHADLVVLTASGSAVDRVRIFLRRFAEAHGDSSGLACLPMPRQDIADHLGLSVETVCRSITTLKTDREIDLVTATRFRFRTRQVAEDGLKSAA